MRMRPEPATQNRMSCEHPGFPKIVLFVLLPNLTILYIIVSINNT